MATVSNFAGLRGGVGRPRSKAPAGAESGFLHEPEAWKELEELMIEPLVRHMQTADAIRVWVPGAATGENAYGVAMLLVEQLEAARKQVLLTPADAVRERSP